MESVSIARLVLSIKELALKILINVNRAQQDTIVQLIGTQEEAFLAHLGHIIPMTVKNFWRIASGRV